MDHLCPKPKHHLKALKKLKKADTLEEQKVTNKIGVPAMDLKGNKLTKYGENGIPSQSRIENSLKIS